MNSSFSGSLFHRSRRKVLMRLADDREHTGSSKDLFEEMATALRLLARDVLKLRSGILVLNVSEEGATIEVAG